MDEKLFLDMGEDEQLEFIKKYADEHKDMSRSDINEFYGLIAREKKVDESEYYYNDYAIFLLSDKVYESILKNIGFDISCLLELFFKCAWIQFENNGQIVAEKYVKPKDNEAKFLETKIIDQDKFFRFFSICLGQLDDFQKAFLQTKILTWPSLFYMFPTEIQNELNKLLDLNFEVKSSIQKVTSEMIYQKFDPLSSECSYNVIGDGQCSVRAANMGYRIYKGNYFKNKNEIKDDMTFDQCINLRKEAHKLTGENRLAKDNYCSWTSPKYILRYFDERDKQNGNETVSYISFLSGTLSSKTVLEFVSSLEKGLFASILDNCIVINGVNKNHAVCLKEDYETRKKYLIGLCDILCDMAIANFSYVNKLNYKKNMIDVTSRYALMPFYDFNCASDNKLLINFGDNKNEVSKISKKLSLMLNNFKAEQRYFLVIELLKFVYSEYKKALEENKCNEMTIKKIVDELLPKFKKEIIDKDKSMKKDDSGLAEKDFFVDLPDGCKTIFEVEDKLFYLGTRYESCNCESAKKVRSNILSTFEPTTLIEPDLAQNHFKQREYLRKRANNHSYFFHALDKESIEKFLDQKIFPWEKFNIYNDRPDIQILALENMDDETKKILLDALKKDNNFFDGCGDDVKKKLIELDIIFDEGLRKFYDLFFKEIETDETKEFIYRPENLKKQLEALDNMDENFRQHAIERFDDYTGMHLYGFIKCDKCLGHELKKKFAQKRFTNLDQANCFGPELINLVFNEENIVNFNDYDIDVLQNTYDFFSGLERLEYGHVFFLLDNNFKTMLQKLGVPIFINSDTDFANEVLVAKSKTQDIYISMFKNNTDHVSVSGCYAKAAIQAYFKQGTMDWSLNENKKILDDFISRSKTNEGEDAFWGHGDETMKFLAKEHNITTVSFGLNKQGDHLIKKYDTNGDCILCAHFGDLRNIAYDILDDCPTIMINLFEGGGGNHFQNLTCNKEKRKQFVYNMFNLYMNEIISKYIDLDNSFGLHDILNWFGIYDDDKNEILAQKFEAIFNELKIRNIDLKLYSILKLYKFLVPKFVEYFIDHRKDNENKSSFDFFNDVFDDIKKEIIDYAKPYSDLIKKFYSKDANGKYDAKNQLEMLNTMDLNSKQLLKSEDLCVANQFDIEVQKKLFDNDIFLYEEFSNLSQEMQVYVLENLNPRKKHKLKLAFEKNYWLFFNCCYEVKEKLYKLGFDIYFDHETEKIMSKKFGDPENKKIDLYKKLANEKYLDDVPAGYCWAAAALKSFGLVSNFEDSDNGTVLNNFVNEIKNKYKDEEIDALGFAKYSLGELSKKYNKRSFYFQINGAEFIISSYDANDKKVILDNYLDMINNILDGLPVCFVVNYPLTSNQPENTKPNHLCNLKPDKKIRIDFVKLLIEFAYLKVTERFKIFFDDDGNETTGYSGRSDYSVDLINKSIEILFGKKMYAENLKNKLDKIFASVEIKFKPYALLALYKFIFDEFTRVYIDENNVNKDLSFNDFFSMVLEEFEKECPVKQEWVKKEKEPENKKPEDIEIKKDEIDNKPVSGKQEELDKKKSNLEQIKRYASAIAAVLGNQDACKIINKLADDELNDFYNKNKDMLEKIKAELRKKENLEKLGLKKEDFLSNGFKLDDEKVNDIAKKFNISYKDKLWFAGLGTGTAVSVALGISMIFLELTALAISSGPVAIGFLVGLIYKLVKQAKISADQKKFFGNIGIDKNDFSRIFNELADRQKNKIRNR